MYAILVQHCLVEFELNDRFTQLNSKSLIYRSHINNCTERKQKL